MSRAKDKRDYTQFIPGRLESNLKFAFLIREIRVHL